MERLALALITPAIATRAIVADLNQDDKADIAVLTLAPSLDVLLEHGNGIFANPVSSATGNCPFPIPPGDYNRDGRLDMAIVNGCDNTLSILLAN